MRSLRRALSAKSRSISPSRRSLMSFDPGPLLASAALTRSLALSPLPAAPDGQLLYGRPADYSVGWLSTRPPPRLAKRHDNLLHSRLELDAFHHGSADFSSPIAPRARQIACPM